MNTLARAREIGVGKLRGRIEKMEIGAVTAKKRLDNVFKQELLKRTNDNREAMENEKRSREKEMVKLRSTSPGAGPTHPIAAINQQAGSQIQR